MFCWTPIFVMHWKHLKKKKQRKKQTNIFIDDFFFFLPQCLCPRILYEDLVSTGMKWSTSVLVTPPPSVGRYSTLSSAFISPSVTVPRVERISAPGQIHHTSTTVSGIMATEVRINNMFIRAACERNRQESGSVSFVSFVWSYFDTCCGLNHDVSCKRFRWDTFKETN